VSAPALSVQRFPSTTDGLPQPRDLEIPGRSAECGRGVAKCDARGESAGVGGDWRGLGS
jgi:hypothetical protein